jgi:cytoskeletal protein RodZ
MRIGWMELSQLVVSVAAAFAFDRYQAAHDPLPTPHSWLLCVLIVGVGAAWIWTAFIVRLAPERFRSD